MLRSAAPEFNHMVYCHVFNVVIVVCSFMLFFNWWWELLCQSIFAYPHDDFKIFGSFRDFEIFSIDVSCSTKA